jgi:hypothetical protein
MPMTDYHFVSIWRLQAPIEQVWDEIFHTERWPSWWKYVHRVDQLDPGDADGLGRRQHLEFTTRLPYRLGFDIQVRHLQPPTTLEAVATGSWRASGAGPSPQSTAGRWSATTGMCGPPSGG